MYTLLAGHMVMMLDIEGIIGITPNSHILLPNTE